MYKAKIPVLKEFAFQQEKTNYAYNKGQII